MTHYMFARFSFREWSYFVNVWGRPLCTGIYAIPANLGGVLGARDEPGDGDRLRPDRLPHREKPEIPHARHRRHLLFAQPLFFAHSFSELTEIPFGLVAICRFWAYQAAQLPRDGNPGRDLPHRPPRGPGPDCPGRCRTGLPPPLVLPLPPAAALPDLELLGALSWGSVKWWPYADAWWTWLPRNWPYSAKSAYGSGHGTTSSGSCR